VNAKVEHPHFSFTRMLAVLMKEFRHMRRDGVTLRLVVALPLMQLILFGYAINGDPKHLPTAVVAADASEFSRSFIEGMRTSRYFEIIRQLNSETEGDRLLAQGRVKFLVVIPADFGRSLMRGEKPVVLVAADATDPSATGNAISSLTQIAQRTLGRDLVGVASRAGTFAPAPVEIRVQARYNPDGITQYNTVPGLMAVVLSLSCTLLTSIAVTKEREKGTLENLLATPVRPLEFMAGKVLPYVVVGYTQAIICLAFARLLFGVPFEGSFLLLMIMTGVFILASLAVGFTFSTLAQTQMQAMQMSQFFFLPGMLLSGFMFPFEGMPKFAQWIGSLLPMTHFLRIVRGIVLKDNGLMDVLPHFWPLLAFTVVAVVIALTRYRQTLD
jgi:ABC-2 type transport system permease protein